MLIAARVSLGLAAAFMTPLASAVFLVLFPLVADRTKAMSVLGSAMMLGLPLGPVVGGALLEHFWWGSVFLINIPLVLLAIVAVALLVPESRGDRPPGIDLVGILSSSAGLVGITYGVIEAGQAGWGATAAWLPMVAGALVLAWLVRWERRQTRVGDPLIDLSLFASRGFTWGTVFTTMPMIGGLLVGATAAGKVKAETGYTTIPVAGFLLTAGGLFIGATTTLGSGYGFTAIWRAARLVRQLRLPRPAHPAGTAGPGDRSTARQRRHRTGRGAGPVLPEPGPSKHRRTSC